MPMRAAPYAGLVLPDASDLDVTDYMTSAAQALGALERDAPRPPRINTAKRAVFGNRYALRILPEADSDFGPRIKITVIARDPETACEEVAANLVSDAVLAMLEHSPCDIIEWDSPDVLIGREDFIRLRSYVSPLRANPVQVPSLPPETDAQTAMTLDKAEETPDVQDLRHALQEPDDVKPLADDSAQGGAKGPSLAIQIMRKRLAESSPEQRRLGAASWAMTGLVSLVSLPVGVAMAIIGGVRGMDFRLVTQSLAVTMLFVALYKSDSISRLMHTLVQ